CCKPRQSEKCGRARHSTRAAPLKILIFRRDSATDSRVPVVEVIRAACGSYDLSARGLSATSLFQGLQVQILKPFHLRAGKTALEPPHPKQGCCVTAKSVPLPARFRVDERPGGVQTYRNNLGHPIYAS